MNKSNFNISNYKKIHLIGFNSPFSQFVAHKLAELKIDFTASDNSTNPEIEQIWNGKNVFLGKNSVENISNEIGLVIYPNGVLPTNVEYAKAKELGTELVALPFAVGYFSKDYKVIAIAGTHGKSTTTALITWMISQCSDTPNFIFGDANDRVFGLETNFNLNPNSPYLVMEACEYKEQFLDRAPKPFISVVTHIDIDHTDYYQSQDQYNQAFIKFLSNTTGAIILDPVNQNEKEVFQFLTSKKFNIFKPSFKGEISSKNLAGAKNYSNAQKAYEVGRFLNFEEQDILNAINSFPGLRFRFEYLGKFLNGANVYRDYAHNPEKISSLLQTNREVYPDKKILLFWQPHNHERTFSFQNDFIQTLQSADLVIIPNIYSVRETEEHKQLILADELVDKINIFYNTEKAIFTEDSGDYSKSFRIIQDLTDENWVIVIASAGDLVRCSLRLRQISAHDQTHS